MKFICQTPKFRVEIPGHRAPWNIGCHTDLRGPPKTHKYPQMVPSICNNLRISIDSTYCYQVEVTRDTSDPHQVRVGWDSAPGWDLWTPNPQPAHPHPIRFVEWVTFQSFPCLPLCCALPSMLRCHVRRVVYV